jgi:hypothetical protein
VCSRDRGATRTIAGIHPDIACKCIGGANNVPALDVTAYGTAVNGLTVISGDPHIFAYKFD